MPEALFSIITMLVAAFFCGIGIYAVRRKKPMWFWSGTSVREDEITDIPAYNRACGFMWIGFSAPFWISAILGFFSVSAGGVLLIADCLIGMPILPAVYEKIYNRYRRP